MIADTLLSERLIACASMIDDMRSRYWWKGRLESVVETLVIMKTHSSRAAVVMKRVAALHSYDVPEIIALPVAAGHGPYLAWVGDSVRTRRTKKIDLK